VCDERISQKCAFNAFISSIIKKNKTLNELSLVEEINA
jgi:hypothetical protein